MTIFVFLSKACDLIKLSIEKTRTRPKWEHVGNAMSAQLLCCVFQHPNIQSRNQRTSSANLESDSFDQSHPKYPGCRLSPPAHTRLTGEGASTGPQACCGSQIVRYARRRASNGRHSTRCYCQRCACHRCERSACSTRSRASQSGGCARSCCQNILTIAD